MLHTRELRQKLRRIHPARLLLFLVDISGSMGRGHMSLAQRAALLLLEKAYIKRDRVAVVAFRDREAALLVPPTNRVETVSRTLTSLTCGGLTPLCRGLAQAVKTLDRAEAGNAALRSTLILLSDGRANVGFLPGHGRMISEIETLSENLSGRARLTTLFFDTTEEGKEDYPARWLAQRLRARRFPLWQIVRAGRDPAAEMWKIMR
jgi:magnesium chelatase subunit D